MAFTNNKLEDKVTILIFCHLFSSVETSKHPIHILVLFKIIKEKYFQNFVLKQASFPER